MEVPCFNIKSYSYIGISQQAELTSFWIALFNLLVVIETTICIALKDIKVLLTSNGLNIHGIILYVFNMYWLLVGWTFSTAKCAFTEYPKDHGITNAVTPQNLR